jgi:hypothetical protein
MKWKKGESGNRAGCFKPGHPYRWPKGRSGNPSGKPQRRLQFEQALADALAGDDPESRANELAELVWSAARKGEPWATQLLFQRLSPQPLAVRMEVERGGTKSINCTLVFPSPPLTAGLRKINLVRRAIPVANPAEQD